MRLLRGLAGVVLWVLAAVLGLVSVILCVTVILLPLGIPLLLLTRRMFTAAVRLMLPRDVAHPLQEAKKSARKKGRTAAAEGSKATGKLAKKGRKAASALPDAAADVSKKARKKAGKNVPKKLRKRKRLALG
jgi:hypothetical protein